MNTSTSWRLHAACADYDPELFFPLGMTGPAFLQVERAKSVCTTCPVRTACLDAALTTGSDHGIWGGLTEEERRSWRGRAARQRTLNR